MLGFEGEGGEEGEGWVGRWKGFWEGGEFEDRGEAGVWEGEELGRR